MRRRDKNKFPIYGSLEEILKAFEKGAGVFTRKDVEILVKALEDKK